LSKDTRVRVYEVTANCNANEIRQLHFRDLVQLYRSVSDVLAGGCSPLITLILLSSLSTTFIVIIRSATMFV